MSWLAPSGVMVRCGNRHRPGRAGPRLPDACQPAEAAPISDITALSLRARLAIALRLFASYCERRGLAHPEIDRYLNHLWEFVGLSGGEGAFRRWVENEPPLTHAGLGDPYPVGFDQVLAAASVPAAEFRQALSCTTEVLYGSMYAAADEAGSRRFVGELAALVVPLGASFPDARPFTGSRWSDGHGWGARPSAEELAVWRGAADT